MCAKCPWEEYLDTIDSLLDDGRYRFATSTLDGIRAWVETNEHITPAQMTAIDNISGSK
jgi:hypothetical protein